MTVDVRKIAKGFALTEEALTKEGLRAFLLDQLRILDAERQARCAKFGVRSLQEMDKLLQKGVVTEEEILEDFRHIDYLTTRIRRVKVMLEEL
jgi:hypothetical protein